MSFGSLPCGGGTVCAQTHRIRCGVSPSTNGLHTSVHMLHFAPLPLRSHLPSNRRVWDLRWKSLKMKSTSHLGDQMFGAVVMVIMGHARQWLHSTLSSPGVENHGD